MAGEKMASESETAEISNRRMAMDVLLTFAGNRDPYNPEVVKGLVIDGPILTLLAERSFAAAHIFTTPNTLVNAQKLQWEIGRRGGNVSRIRIHNIDIPDPTDYEALFPFRKRAKEKFGL